MTTDTDTEKQVPDLGATGSLVSTQREESEVGTSLQNLQKAVNRPKAPLILMAEDSPRDAELTCELLRSADADIQADVVSTPQDFESRVLENDYDVVLADFHLGAWTALDALEILQRLGKDLPLILLTGCLGDEKAVECIRSGVFDYVLKDRMSRLPLAIRKAMQEAARRKARQRLEREVRLLASAIRSVEDGVFIVENSGQLAQAAVVFANRAACEISGYAETELLGASLPALFRSPDGPGMFELAQEALESTKTFHWETAHMRKDGAEYFAEWRISPLVEDGAVTHYVCVHRDLSEAKQHEQELRKTVAELARSNADLTQFAYVASHDLREPLRMITMYLNLLERRYKDKLDTEANEFIDFAVEGARRMQHLTQDLLLYARAGLGPLHYSEVDFDAVLKAALTNLKMKIEEQGAAVTHDPLPTVRGSVEQMVQVFQNLIENAIRFRSEAPPKVHVSAEYTGTEWVFSVCDNGIGIAPEHHSRVFGLFQRLHARSEYPGTGIGLAFCKQAIERRGGRIWVHSDSGRGATFYFSVPDAHSQPSRNVAEDRNPASPHAFRKEALDAGSRS